MAEMALTAAATSTSSAPKSLAPSMPLSCWMRNFDSVVRPRCMVGLLQVSSVCRSDGENAAGADIGLGDRRQILGREFSILLRKEPASLPQPGSIQRVTHAARIGKMWLRDAMRQEFLERRARAGAETIVLLLEHLVRNAQQIARGVVRKIQMMR